MKCRKGAAGEGGAGGDDREVTFTGIDRGAYKSLFDFLSSKRITIQNIAAGAAAGLGPAGGDAEDSEENADDDAYTRRLKREAKAAAAEEDEEDSDFGPGGDRYEQPDPAPPI